MLVVLLCFVAGSEDGRSPTFWLLLYTPTWTPKRLEHNEWSLRLFGCLGPSFYLVLGTRAGSRRQRIAKPLPARRGAAASMKYLEKIAQDRSLGSS